MSSAKASLVSVIGLCIAWAVSGSLMQPRQDGKRPASALTLWTRCCHPGEAGEVAKMSFPDAVLSRLVLIRVLPGLLIVVYLSAIIASHSVPLDSGLGTTMGLAGMFTVIVVLFVTALRQFARKGLIARPPREWARFVHLALFVVVGVACYFALTGNVSLACPLDRPPQDVASCLKSDNWKTSGGHYYVQSPYDSEGNDDPGAPWVEISRAEYVADIGSLVRQDALFGGIPLVFAWFLAGVGRNLGDEEELPKIAKSTVAGLPGGSALSGSEVTEKVRAGSSDPANRD